MAEASKGGWVRQAARSSARTRPRHSPSGTRSASSGVNPSVTRARASVTLSKAMKGLAAKCAGLESAGAATGLLDQPDTGEGHGTVDRLHHVVNGEAGDRHRGQRLYLHAGLCLDLGGRLDLDAGWVARRCKLDRDLG